MKQRYWLLQFYHRHERVASSLSPSSFYLYTACIVGYPPHIVLLNAAFSCLWKWFMLDIHTANLCALPSKNCLSRIFKIHTFKMYYYSLRYNVWLICKCLHLQCLFMTQFPGIAIYCDLLDSVRKGCSHEIFKLLNELMTVGNFISWDKCLVYFRPLYFHQLEYINPTNITKFTFAIECSKKVQVLRLVLVTNSYVLSHVESVSSVEGSRTRRRRRRRRTRPRSQTPSGEHVDCRPSDHLPGSSVDKQGEFIIFWTVSRCRERATSTTGTITWNAFLIIWSD